MIEVFISPITLSHIKGEKSFLTDSEHLEPQDNRVKDLEQFNAQTLVEFFGLVAVGITAIALAGRNNNKQTTKQEVSLVQTSAS